MASEPQSPLDSSPHAPLRTFQRRGRFFVWVLFVTVITLGMPAWMFFLRGELLVMRLELLRAGLIGGAALIVLTWILLASTPADSIRLSQRTSKRLILVISAVLAGTAAGWLVPLVDDEPLRYRADGTSWLSGASPYSTTPQEVQATWQSVGDDESPLESPDDPFIQQTRTLLEAAPGQDRATRVGPILQAAAVLVRAIEFVSPPGQRQGDDILATRPASSWRDAMVSLPWWRQLLPWRLMLGAAYLLVVGELIAWLRQREKSVWWAVTFAWVPLTWFTSIGLAHGELVGVLLFIAALRRLELRRNRRAALCLAGAIAVQPLAILIAPFAIRNAIGRAERSETDGLAKRRFTFWLVATTLLLWLPVLLVDGGWRGFGDSVIAYVNGVDDTWRNAPLPRVIVALILDDADPTRRLWVRLLTIGVGAIGLMLVGAIAWTRQVRIEAAAYALLLASFLLAGDAPPWRVIWPLAMVPILTGRGGLTALLWAGTCALHYTTNTVFDGTNPANVLVAEYIPVYIAASIEVYVAFRRPRPNGERMLPG